MRVRRPGPWRGELLSNQPGIFCFPRIKSAPVQKEAAAGAVEWAEPLLCSSHHLQSWKQQFNLPAPQFPYIRYILESINEPKYSHMGKAALGFPSHVKGVKHVMMVNQAEENSFCSLL